MGNICTFFGHRDTYLTPKQQSQMKGLLSDLIVNEKVDVFFVGAQGNFDNLATQMVQDLKKQFPHIRLFLILAYHSVSEQDFQDKLLSYISIYDDIVLPDVGKSLPKFALVRRNAWMVRQSDYVICYLKRTSGGVFRAAKLAKKQKKIIYNLVSDMLD